MDSHLTRRGMLALSAAGLSSIAGCSDIGLPSNTDDTSTPWRPEDPDDTDPDGPSNQPPETAAGYIHANDGKRNYTIHDLQPYERVYPSNGDGSVEWLGYRHPDSRPITTTVSDNTVSITVPSMKLQRDLILRVHHPLPNGGTDTKRKQVSPQSDSFQTYTWEFDLSAVPIPTLNENTFHVTVEDTHPGDNAERTLTIHTHMAYPYGNGNTYHLNAPEIQHKPYTTDGRVNFDNPDRYHSEHIDHDGKRTRVYAIFPDNPWAEDVNAGRRLFGAVSSVPHSAYNEYKANERNSSYRRSHHPATYSYNATDFDYFTTFANSFVTSLSNHGITDHFAKLEILNFLIGAMDYQGDIIDDPQLAAIYEGTGDCTEHTHLYLALLNTPAFDHTRGSRILCDVNLGSPVKHMVVGIDERDLGDHPRPGQIRWVTPTERDKQNGIPDTRYAFADLTNPSTIGNAVNIEKVYGVSDTTNCDRHPEYRAF